jgi:hypothetical protein
MVKTKGKKQKQKRRSTRAATLNVMQGANAFVPWRHWHFAIEVLCRLAIFDQCLGHCKSCARVGESL